MSLPYSYLSEILRTPYMCMHAGFLDYYRSEIMRARGNKDNNLEALAADRAHPSILIFKKGRTDYEERLIMTSNSQWYDEEELNEDDQIINVIPLKGPILSSGGPCTYGTAELADRFIYADSKPSVIGHFVIIDTPGGSAYANELNPLFENAKKPVVALIRNLCCSKGVEIASHIPHVFAETPTAEIGCIGVVASFAGIKSGTVVDGEVFYSVYADSSPDKNREYRKAIEEGDLNPMREKINELNAGFIANVKKRWPECKDERLTGITYKASEVEGELFDGYKSYSEAIDYIFQLAGESRKEQGVITPMGIIPSNPDDDSEIINTNSQKQFTPMTNIEVLESILGKGTVQVDENGIAQLTTEQLTALIQHYENMHNAASQANKLVSTQLQLLASKEQELAVKDSQIQELSQATSRGISQAPPENDNLTEQASVLAVETALEGISDPSEKLKTVRTIAEKMGLIQS